MESEEESGLIARPLRSTETIGIIIGTNIGAGVLGMAYAARKAGYVPLLICLVLTCIFVSLPCCMWPRPACGPKVIIS